MGCVGQELYLSCLRTKGAHLLYFSMERFSIFCFCVQWVGFLLGRREEGDEATNTNTNTNKKKKKKKQKKEKKKKKWNDSRNSVLNLGSFILC